MKNLARHRWLLVVVPLAMIAAGVAAWQRARASSSAETVECPLIRGTEYTERLDWYRQAWASKAGRAEEGEEVVEIADTPAGSTWRYRTVIAVPAFRTTIEGEYRPGAVDERTTTWQPADEMEARRSRAVVIGEDAWIDEADDPSWFHCHGLGDRVPYADKNLTFGAVSLGPNGSPCRLDDCTFDVVPGSRVRVGNPVSSVIDGEPVTTYEVRGVVRPAFTEEEERLRATITVDGERRLRGAKVWDAVTGSVYLTMTAGPAPGNPPIVDPSDQPRFSQQPPPPPPPTETVPVAPAPAG